jgi:hypothetical protein
MKSQSARALIVILSLATLQAAPRAFADGYTFALLPAGGNVAGPPGSTVGWGYSITNQSTTDWLVTSALNSDSFLFGTPNLIFDFPDLGPRATTTVPFDLVAGTGLFELTWDSSAPVGFMNFGIFTLSAEWYDGDPLGTGNYISDASDTKATYSATVSPAAVPEPSVALLLGTGLATLFLRIRRRARVARALGDSDVTPPAP